MPTKAVVPTVEPEPDPPTVAIVPHTGQVVDLASPVDCREALESLSDAMNAIAGCRRQIVEALASQAALIGKKTLDAGDGAKVVLSGGPVKVYDVDELSKLLDAGLPAARFGELVVETVTTKVNASVLKQIEASGNPDYKVIIDRATSVEPRPFSASVKR